MDQIRRPKVASHLKLWSLPALLLSLTVSSAVALAQGAEPADLPKNKVELGNAFVSAWLGFRRDLDSLEDPGFHPALLDLWFAEMPGFLAEDAARLATSHHVILAAASRVAAIGGERSRLFLSELEKAHEETPLERSIIALRIRAGDIAARDEMQRELTSGNLERSIRAAQAFAEAGDVRGLAFIRRMLKKGGNGADAAALLLGRFGSAADEAGLAKSIARDPDNEAIASAYGECALRRLFPNHYAAVSRRGAVFDRIDTAGTMYDAWFAVVGEAIRRGAKSSAEIAAAVDEKRKQAEGDVEPELARRQLKTLLDLWRDVDAILAKASARPQWPSGFGEAKARIFESPKKSEENPDDQAKKIAAKIAVLRWAGAKLDYERLSGSAQGLKIYAVNGKRAVDGNFATSWYGVKGASLKIESDEKDAAKSLWIACACDDLSEARILEVEVTGSGAKDQWTVKSKLEKESLYFQEIQLEAKPARWLELKLSATSGNGPSCVSEIRLLQR